MNSNIIAESGLKIQPTDTIGEALGKVATAYFDALSKVFNPDYYINLLRILRGSRKRRSKKRENFISTIKAVNYYGMEFTKTDLAFIAGSTREYVSRNFTNVTKIAEIEEKCDIRELDRFKAKSLELMLTHAKTHKEIMGAYFAHSVRFETDILDRIEDSGDLVDIGTSLVEISRKILEKKPEEGEDHSAKVWSKTWAVRHLQRQKIDLIDKFFLRKTPSPILNKEASKRTGTKVYKQPPFTWFMLPTTKERLEKVVEKAVNFIFKSRRDPILSLRGILNVTQECPHIHRRALKCDFKELTYTTTKSEKFEVSQEIFGQFSFRSQLLLLNHYLGRQNGKLIFNANHSSPKNQNLGRTYGVITRIKSEERLMAGYNAYDIEAGLQAICLNFIDQKEFPLLTQYAFDPEYKRATRAEMLQELQRAHPKREFTMAKVKGELTAYSNGRKCDLNSTKMREFAKESKNLRERFMDFMNREHPEVVERAERQKKADKKDNPESSVFFFAWTWFERKIRLAMLELFEDGIQLHDAVYSRKLINTKEVEKHIFDRRKLKVRILIEPGYLNGN